MIVREAGSLPEDLVILGSPHRSLASWLLDTSFVQRFIVESQCPVITMKPSLEAATGTENLNDAVDAKV
jgi:nucleotide-binding universal stress UspA family protein